MRPPLFNPMPNAPMVTATQPRVEKCSVVAESMGNGKENPKKGDCKSFTVSKVVILALKTRVFVCWNVFLSLDSF